MEKITYKLQELIPGKTYVYEWGSGNRVIVLHEDNTSRHFISAINTYLYGPCCNDTADYRMATEEETAWLQACIEAEKSVPQPKLETIKEPVYDIY